MSLRTRSNDAAVTLKIEAVAGIYEAPDPATDMVEAAGGLVTPDNPQVIETNTFTGTIIDRRPEIGRVPMGMPLEVPMKGTSLTAGAVDSPEWETWARISGLEPSAGTAIASGAVTAAAMAGGRQTFTVATGGGWSATDHGMLGRVVLVDITGSDPTPTPAHIIVYDVTGGSAVVTIAEALSAPMTVTSTVEVPAARVFVLADEPPTASVDLYRQARKWTLNGAGADSQIVMPSGGRWSMNGQILARLEGDNPTDGGPTPDDSTDQVHIKPRWKRGRALLGGVEIAVDTATVAINAERYQADNPNEDEAIEATCIVRMRPRVDMVPLVSDLATRNSFDDFRNNNPKDIVFATDLEAVAGSRFSFIAPIAQYTNAAEQDRAGFIGETVSAVIDGSRRAYLTIW